MVRNYGHLCGDIKKLCDIYNLCENFFVIHKGFANTTAKASVPRSANVNPEIASIFMTVGKISKIKCSLCKKRNQKVEKTTAIEKHGHFM